MNTEPITFSFSFAALALSYFSFRRQRTMENENHLFKYKMDKYNSILKSMRETQSAFRKEIDGIYAKHTLETLTNEDIAQTLLVVARYADKAQIDLQVDAAFLPSTVVGGIQEYIDKLFGADFIFNVEETEYAETIEHLNNLENKLYEIAEAMRADLGIDKLGKRLIKRVND
jgi:hypothetical protein